MNRFLKGAMILTLAGIIVRSSVRLVKFLSPVFLVVKASAIYDGLSNLPNYR